MSYVPGGYEPRREPLGQPAYMPPVTPSAPQPFPFELRVGDQPVPVTHYAPPSKKRRGGLIAGLVIAAVLLLGGGGTVLAFGLTGHTPVSIPGVASTMTVHGSLTISNDCSGWGYDDIRSGAEVTVTDESGKVLAVGQLLKSAGCTWTFTVDKVPTGAKFYGVAVSHRGTVHFTEQEMRGGPELSLG